MIDQTAIVARLTALLEDEIGQPAPSFDQQTDLRTGLGLDSVDLVGLIMRIENHYRIRLAHFELSTITTVGELVALVASKVADLPSTSAEAA